jgi:hypothetical protein
MKMRGIVPSFCIHVCVSDLYIFPRSVCLFCCIAFADRSWEYINRSQTVECRNWETGRPVSFLGIFVSNFRYSAFAVHIYKAGTALDIIAFQIPYSSVSNTDNSCKHNVFVQVSPCCRRYFQDPFEKGKKIKHDSFKGIVSQIRSV